MPTENSPLVFSRPQKFTYNELNDREFEELLFTIFRKHRLIGKKPFSDLYEEAHLMPGVGEKGRDIILSKNNQYVGLVQCKCVKHNLTKPDCAKEIIKFVINAICNDTLISNKDNFTYFLVSSTGFSETAISLIATFNHSILKESDLQKWTENVISKYKEFKHLKYQSIEHDLKDILGKLKVEKIIPTQLNGWLSYHDYVDITKQFFPSVLLVQSTPNSTALVEASALPSNEQITQQFYTASSDLLTWPSTFEGLGDYHLNRIETENLLKWIKEPLPQDSDSKEPVPPVAVLVGGAGYGKTTVLIDLLKQLSQQKIPVIGLKADRLTLNQRKDLEQELHLSDNIDVLIERLAEENERIVVIIDQIDALSQSLSASREVLYVYNRLIEYLATLPHIRIVISCRQFDLEYDPALKQYKKKHIVTMAPLSEDEVKNVLEHVGLSDFILTSKLYQLLMVPLHLNIFCKVYREATDLSGLATVQDLYHELWSQKIASVPNTATFNGTDICTTVQRIARQMYDLQQISIPYRPFESAHKTVIDYLNSHSLIMVTESKIQFFHQSFFDYVFARTFVDQRLSISIDISGSRDQPKHQGLFIRSMVRQVLIYLREVDEQAYAHEVVTILTGAEYRFHIKLLILQLLAFQSDPLPIEQFILTDKIRPNQLLWEVFMETVATPNWFRYMESNFLNQYLIQETESAKGRVYQLCLRIQIHSPHQVVEFINQLPDFSERDEFIASLLFILDDFSHPATLELVERVLPTRQNDEMWFYQVMQHAIEAQSVWVSEQIRLRILNALDQQVNDNNISLPVEGGGSYFLETLEKLHKKDQDTAFATGLVILEALIEKSPLSWQAKLKSGLISDRSFWQFVPEETNHDASTQLMIILRGWLLQLFERDATSGLKQVSDLLTSDLASIVMIGLHGVISHPQKCALVFFERLISPFFVEEYGEAHHRYFSYSVEKSLQVCFPYFNETQQQTIIQIILRLNPKNEYVLHKQQGIKALWWTGLQQYNLLNMLPAMVIDKSPLKARYQQLYRKFGTYKQEKPGRITWRPGRTLSDSAYLKMTDKDWLNSFDAYKYDNKKGSRWDDVDELSHAQRFAKEVEHNPNLYIPLIETLIDRNDLPELYLYYGLEGLKTGNVDITIFKKLFYQTVPRTFENQHLHWLVRLSDYFVEKEDYDKTVFEFLADSAMKGSQETGINNELLTDGINHLRGAAIYRLLDWISVDTYREQIFQILEQVPVDGLLSTKAVALHLQAHLNRYDKQRSLRLFINLCEGNEAELAKTSVGSLQYNIHIDFISLISFFENSIKAEEAQNEFAQILMVAYKFGYPESDIILEKYLQTGVEAISGAIKIAMSGLNDKELDCRERCTQIAYRFLDLTDEKINRAYTSAFFHFKVDKFKDLQPFLNKYANSHLGRFRDNEFFLYLLKCVKSYPKECLVLAANFDQNRDIGTYAGYLRHEPIEIVLQAYNTFQKFIKPSDEKEIAMDIFDRLLQNPVHRNSINKITDSLN